MTEEHQYCLYSDSLPDWGVTNIVLAEDETGLIFFPVRTMCRGVGIDSPTQTGIISDDSELAAESRDIKLPSGRGRGKHKTLCLTKIGVAKWLAGVDEKRVAPRARGRLQEYKRDLWQLATRLVFTRKRVAEAGLEEVGEIVQVIGTERLEIDCDVTGPHRHILEKTNGVWRHWVVELETAE